MIEGLRVGMPVHVQWSQAVMGKSGATPDQMIEGRIVAIDGSMVEVEVNVPGERGPRRLRLHAGDLAAGSSPGR